MGYFECEECGAPHGHVSEENLCADCYFKEYGKHPDGGDGDDDDDE